MLNVQGVAFIIFCFIINKVIRPNISLIILSVFIIIEFGPPCHCFKTLSHIKHFRMSQNRALNKTLTVFLYT